MKLPLHEYILLVAQIAALACLVVRLVAAGLVREYRFFFSFILLELLEGLIPFTVPYGDVYGWAFVVSASLKLGFYVLIVFELYSVLLRDLAGIARMARRYSMLALAIAVLLSVLVVTALPLPRNPLRRLFYVEIPILSALVLYAVDRRLPGLLPGCSATQCHCVRFRVRNLLHLKDDSFILKPSLRKCFTSNLQSDISRPGGLLLDIFDDFPEPRGRTANGFRRQQVEPALQAATGPAPPPPIER